MNVNSWALEVYKATEELLANEPMARTSLDDIVPKDPRVSPIPGAVIWGVFIRGVEHTLDPLDDRGARLRVVWRPDGPKGAYPWKRGIDLTHASEGDPRDAAGLLATAVWMQIAGCRYSILPLAAPGSRYLTVRAISPDHLARFPVYWDPQSATGRR